MKILKIEKDNGYYIIDSTTKEIKDLNKDDLFLLMQNIWNLANLNPSLNIDDICDINQDNIKNKANAIIYDELLKLIRNFLESDIYNIKQEIKKFEESLTYQKVDEEKI